MRTFEISNNPQVPLHSIVLYKISYIQVDKINVLENPAVLLSVRYYHPTMAGWNSHHLYWQSSNIKFINQFQQLSTLLDV